LLEHAINAVINIVVVNAAQKRFGFDEVINTVLPQFGLMVLSI